VSSYEKSVLHFDGKAVLKTQEISSKITADTKRIDLLNLHSQSRRDGPAAPLGSSVLSGWYERR
jgi:hypothetical protein